MALNFNNGSGDRVVVAAATSINDLDPFTVWGWFYVLGKTSSDRLWSKAGNSAGEKALLLAGTSGDIQLVVGRAVSQASFVTNDTPLSTNNKWYFIAVTFNSGNGAGEAAQIYVGDLTTTAAERSYSTSNNGNGSLNPDSSKDLYIGNRQSDQTRSFPGHIASWGLVNRELTLAEVISLQWNPRVVPGTVAYYELGFNGTGTQPDWSGNGNSGTVTTATQVAHVPIGPMVTDVGGWLGAVAAAATAQQADTSLSRVSLASALGAAGAGAPVTLARAGGLSAGGLAGTLASATISRWGGLTASTARAMSGAVALARGAAAAAAGTAAATAGTSLLRLAGLSTTTGEILSACIAALHRVAAALGLTDQEQTVILVMDRVATAIGLATSEATTIELVDRPAATIALADWCS